MNQIQLPEGMTQKEFESQLTFLTDLKFMIEGNQMPDGKMSIEDGSAPTVKPNEISEDVWGHVQKLKHKWINMKKQEPLKEKASSLPNPIKASEHRTF